MLSLGVDTSCDDTSLALVEGERVIVNLSANQDEFHARFGGVVPEISSRKHLEMILPLFVHLLEKADIKPADINLVAATKGPGLIGGLLVGVAFANVVAGSMGIPAVGVHHLEGHIFSTGIDAPPVPERHLALIISGGHTRLVAVERRFEYSEIGATRDDAAGELLDKTGRLLGFPYPGGKAVDDAAMAYGGEPIVFPKPLIASDDYDFSFSGLKTAVLYYIRDHKTEPSRPATPLPGTSLTVKTGAIAKGVMISLAKVLATKASKACGEMGFDTLAVSGGVSASRFLREYFADYMRDRDITVRFPEMPFTTDNAAMIAAAGYARFNAGLANSGPIDSKASLALE